MSTSKLATMTDLLATVRANLAAIEERIAHATASAGRPEGSVKLIGVTKYVGAAETAALVAAGCRRLGESRPQQFWSKADSPELSKYDLEWHLIGHLQRNKVARTVALGPLIHGVDSNRILMAINKAAEVAGTTAKVLLEVNCSGDSEKHGILPERLAKDVEELGVFGNVRVRGLMTMAARDGGTDTARRNFALLRKLRDKVAPLTPEGHTLDELSMGMSGDFEQAILEGSTLVRIGSALWEGIK